MTWQITSPLTRVYNKVHHDFTDRHDSDLSNLLIPKAPSAKVKLGLTDPYTRHALRLSDYIDTTAAPAISVPKAVHRSHREIQWGMLGNDQYGDCVPVMGLHSEMAFAADAGNAIPTYVENDALEIYSGVAGFDPNNPTQTDNGSDMQAMMDYWKNTGLAGGKKIVGSLAVDFQSTGLVERAIWEFVALQIAVSLPLSAQGRPDWSIPKGGWDSSNGPGTWGGHAIPILSFDGRNFVVVTWGQDLIMKYDFARACVVQSFVVITEDMLGRTGVSPAGVNWTALLSDFHAIGG